MALNHRALKHNALPSAEPQVATVGHLVHFLLYSLVEAFSTSFLLFFFFQGCWQVYTEFPLYLHSFHSLRPLQ